MRCVKSRPGVLFLDLLIGVGVFAVIVTGVVYAMLFSQQGMLKSGDRIRGVFLNQKAIAAVRAVRDNSFEDLTEGTFGIALDAEGEWELTGTEVTIEDGYTTRVILASLEENRMQVTADTSWNFGISGSGRSVLQTEITDWRRVQSIGNWSDVSLDGAYTDEGTPLFNHAVVTGDYAFVTSKVSDGGAGLYVLDIHDTASPVRRAEGFDLGAEGYGLVAVGDTLFVASGDGGAEIRIYDISTPETLSADDQIGTINVPGTGRVRSIAYYDETLFIACQEDPAESEFYAYDVEDQGSPVLLDELNDAGASFNDLRLFNSYAYLASAADTMELRIVDVFDPADLSFAPGGGYNLTDTPDATSVAPMGGYLLLGRMQGDVTEEMHLFDIAFSPVPTTDPFTMEAGEHVNAMDVDPTATYGFASTDHDSQELVVLDLASFAAGGNPITETYNTETGFGRGVYYDIVHDRVLLLTNTAVVLLRPS